MTKAIVIGGGVIGCSVAFHLAGEIGDEVLVLERREIASQATPRSAGLVLRGRAKVETLRMVERTREAIAEIERETGEEVGFSRVGSLRVATQPGTADTLRAMDALLRSNGVDVANPDAGEATDMAPWLDASDAVHISHVADDGYVDPHRLTWGYARAARRRGARFRTGAAATGLLRANGRIAGVATDDGPIEAEWVVDAAGAWAAVVASWLGAPIPATPVRSHYWISAPHDLAPRAHPVVALPDARAYLRPEVGGLLIGVQEPESAAYDARAIPDDAESLALTDRTADWEILLRHSEDLRRHIRPLDELRFAHHIAGLSVYSPDGGFVIGGFDECPGFVAAAGCCGTGVSTSGGFGRIVADIVLGRPPSIDASAFRPDRFGRVDAFSPEFRAACAAARGAKGRRG